MRFTTQKITIATMLVLVLFLNACYSKNRSNGYVPILIEFAVHWEDDDDAIRWTCAYLPLLDRYLF